MTHVKRWVVIAIEWACGQLDRIPTFYRCQDMHRCYGFHCAYGAFGCGWLRLAIRSYELDARWNTRVWGDATEPPRRSNE